MHKTRNLFRAKRLKKGSGLLLLHCFLCKLLSHSYLATAPFGVLGGRGRTSSCLLLTRLYACAIFTTGNDGLHGRMPGAELFEHLGICGIAALRLFDGRQAERFKQIHAELARGIEIERRSGIAEDQALAGVAALGAHLAEVMQGLRVAEADNVRPLRQHRAQRQLDVQRDVFLFNTRLQTVEERGDIARQRRALADDDRIVQLRRSVREAAESAVRNGMIDTNGLLRKIADEDAASAARSAREIELLKTIYELKQTKNRRDEM